MTTKLPANMDTTMTTFERADGELTDDAQWWGSSEPFDNSEPTDVVEKHWVLIKYRMVRLGEPDLCKRCGGDGGDQSLRCEPCRGTGDETRDDPPYIRAGRHNVETQT